MVVEAALEPLRAGLVELSGYPFRVRVSHGEERRGAEVARLAARAYAWLEGVMGISPDVDLRVLALEDWREFAPASAPYGVPYAWIAGELMTTVTPAPFWTEAIDYFAPDLDASAWTRLRAAFGDPIDVGSGMLDMSVVHEMGHIFHLLDAVPVYPRAALAEMFANIVMYSFYRETQPDQVERIDAAAHAASCVDVRRLPVSALRDVAVATQHDEGVSVDIWYTFMLLGHARRVWETAGSSVLPGLQHVIRTDLSWEDTVPALEAVHPALAAVVTDWP